MTNCPIMLLMFRLVCEGSGSRSEKHLSRGAAHHRSAGWPECIETVTFSCALYGQLVPPYGGPADTDNCAPEPAQNVQLSWKE